MANTDPLSPAKDFASLSLLDLLYARDLFHVHLMNKQNVVATAVGRYLVRKTDPYPAEAGLKKARNGKKAAKGPKRLQECEVRFYSWPAVLVFVSEWIPDRKFGTDGVASSDYIPPAIYLPDGREVPICVVEAKPVEEVPAAPSDMAFPQNLIGGGYPLVTRVQGDVHLASIGCLVTDGHKAFALTNRHVAGDPGERVYAVVDGKEISIGTSSKKQLGRQPFSDIYPGWPGRDVLVNMDVGLVELDDKSRWTAQVYGVGQLGRAADVNVDNLSLRIIGAPVRAYGCASRQMSGQILALFYRFGSSGGFEHVTDFLIGPKRDSSKPLRTGPGDSGTVWLLENGERKKGDPDHLRPIAVQWGGHRFLGGAGQYPFALATSFGNACARLEVDVVRDWNIGVPEYWGAVGHFSIALQAIAALKQGNLRTVMNANVLNITYDADHIKAQEMQGLSKRPFIPLADVPDYSFKMGPHRAREQPNHFADMDRLRPSDQKTLLDLCKNGAGLDVATWQAYYTDVKDPGRGTLPFRVWQCFDAMVGYAKRGDLERFVCAAGVVSHYLGDACQPLHISYLFNGDPDREAADGTPYANGVHAAYEDTMVNAYTPELLAQVDASRSAEFGDVNAGRDAAALTVELMRRTLAELKPRDILDAFEPVRNGSRTEIADTLWSQFGAGTVQVMSFGAAALAHLWEEAWRVGQGDKNVAVNKNPIDHEILSGIYGDEYLKDQFLPSYTLNQIAAALDGAGAPQPPQNGPQRARGRAAVPMNGGGARPRANGGTRRPVRGAAAAGRRRATGVHP
jgi:hypothetical protein